MGNTRFSGPVSSGDIPNSYSVGTTNYTTNVGLAVLMQTALINAGAATSNVVTSYLPQQSQIISFNVDTITAWSNATAGLTIGTPTNATAYWAGTTALSTGRIIPTFATGTSVLNLSNIGTTPAVVFTLNQNQQTGSGSTLVTIVYTQTTSTFS